MFAGTRVRMVHTICTHARFSGSQGSSGLLGHDIAAVSITLITIKFQINPKLQFKYSLNQLIQIELTKHKTYKKIKDITEN